MLRFLTPILLVSSFFSYAQDYERLSIYLDCSNTWCDRQFIKTELSVVDYSVDRIDSDIHVLLTSQRNGSGGLGYQIIMYGQGSLTQLKDTINFDTHPNATDFQRRDEILKYLKLALVPYLIHANQYDLIELNFVGRSDSSIAGAPVKDPWDYWVFRIGANGNIQLDQNYENLEAGGYLRIDRITDKIKFGIRVGGSEEIATYTYKEDGVTDKTIVQNYDYGFRHYLIWSLRKKWAYGYEIGYNTNSFTNIRNQYYASPSIEYNLFPYSDVNNKLLTLRYGVGLGFNQYGDTTIYDQTEEFLTAEYLSLSAEFNQKWGNVEMRLKYQHFFRDLALNNLSFGTQVEIQITGGLSVDLYLFGALVHDQIYLVKGDASSEDVLTRQRQLASSFEFEGFIGLNYRFGSKINNFVNPRFGSRGF